MDWEQRQASLESEMMVAKDTIWGLTARIIHLENEVKNLKIVVKYGAKKYPGNISKGKAAEMATMARCSKKMGGSVSKRKNIAFEPEHHRIDSTMKNLQRMSNISGEEVRTSQIPNSDEHSLDIDEHTMPTVVKLEVDPEIDDSEHNAGMSATSEDSDNSEEGLYSGTSQSQSTYWKTTNISRHPNRSINRKFPKKISNKSLHNHNPTPGAAQWANSQQGKIPFRTLHRKSTAVGRKRDPVWKHFTVIENLSEFGPARPTAICKKCNKTVSPQPGRLSKHIKNCRPEDNSHNHSRTAESTRIVENPGLVPVETSVSNTEIQTT